MTVKLKEGQRLIEEVKLEVAPGIFQNGQPILNEKNQVIGCSLHPESSIRCHVVSDDTEINWCVPRDGELPHILIGRTSTGSMSAEQLKPYAWFASVFKKN